jgi:hypothetical protein
MQSEHQVDSSQITSLTGKIVKAFVANNQTSPEDVTNLISNVGSALKTATQPNAGLNALAEAKGKRGTKIVRRRGGKVIDDDQQQSEQSDEQQSDEASIDQTDESEETVFEDVSSEDEETDEDDGDISQWEVDDEGNRIHPEPMFG